MQTIISFSQATQPFSYSSVQFQENSNHVIWYYRFIDSFILILGDFLKLFLFLAIVGKVKGERIFGFSFIKLLKGDGTVTRDGSYELFIYKVSNILLLHCINPFDIAQFLPSPFIFTILNLLFTLWFLLFMNEYLLHLNPNRYCD